ncbi:MAG: hypothetical protein IM319_18985 [Microcystis sp. M113S1]|jgi:hypothetical protein|nr:hypothetical protein [Microcystis sp. M113S1]
MNEQRTRAYLNLVNQLLSCNDGDESRILRENQELLDRGLIEVAQKLEKLGDSIKCSGYFQELERLHRL